MLYILTETGEHLYGKGRWTDYEVNYGFLIIKKEDTWIGMYNLNYLKEFKVYSD